MVAERIHAADTATFSDKYSMTCSRASGFLPTALRISTREKATSIADLELQKSNRSGSEPKQPAQVAQWPGAIGRRAMPPSAEVSVRSTLPELTNQMCLAVLPLSTRSVRC